MDKTIDWVTNIVTRAVMDLVELQNPEQEKDVKPSSRLTADLGIPPELIYNIIKDIELTFHQYHRRIPFKEIYDSHRGPDGKRVFGDVTIQQMIDLTFKSLNEESTKG